MAEVELGKQVTEVINHFSLGGFKSDPDDPPRLYTGGDLPDFGNLHGIHAEHSAAIGLRIGWSDETGEYDVKVAGRRDSGEEHGLVVAQTFPDGHEEVFGVNKQLGRDWRNMAPGVDHQHAKRVTADDARGRAVVTTLRRISAQSILTN